MTVARNLQCLFLGIILSLCGFVQYSNMLLVADRALANAPLVLLASHGPFTQDSGNIFDKAEHLVPLYTEQRFLATLALVQVEQHSDARTIAHAKQALVQIPNGPEREADEARLAEIRGDYSAALKHGIHAHAVAVVESTLDAIEARGRLRLSEMWDRRFLAVLQTRATDREAVAAALWRLGRLENSAADRATSAISATERLAHQHQALQAFRAELGLTPYSGRALLTAGYLALALGYLDEARRDFSAALASDPASASGLVGLARIALHEHQLEQACHYAQRALLFAPQQHDVVQLRRDLNMQ